MTPNFEETVMTYWITVLTVPDQPQFVCRPEWIAHHIDAHVSRVWGTQPNGQSHNWRGDPYPSPNRLAIDLSLILGGKATDELRERVASWRPQVSQWSDPEVTYWSISLTIPGGPGQDDHQFVLKVQEPVKPQPTAVPTSTETPTPTR